MRGKTAWAFPFAFLDRAFPDRNTCFPGFPWSAAAFAEDANKRAALVIGNAAYRRQWRAAHGRKAEGVFPYDAPSRGRGSAD